VVPSIGNPFFTSLVRSVEHVLEREGKDLFLCDAQSDPVIEAGLAIQGPCVIEVAC